ncbi:MAG: SpoIIE family protein phosphatase [Spirochaetia bacterium]|nr:SpoIIE family protein phosphatase [Spirochaetia bacterium]
MISVSGNKTTFSLEHRIFNVVCFIGFIGCIILGILNYVLDMPRTLAILALILSVIVGSFYYISRFKNQYQMFVWPLILLFLTAFSYFWFLGAGFQGTTLYGFICVFCGAIIILPEDSKLFFYTDGIIDAVNPQNTSYRFEDGPLLKFLQENKDNTPEGFILNLYENLVEFRGDSSFEDDICMIAMNVD